MTAPRRETAMTVPPALARDAAIDAAARAILETLASPDRHAALARLERLSAEVEPGPRRRALLAARVALLHGMPLPDPTAPEIPPPDPDPQP